MPRELRPRPSNALQATADGGQQTATAHVQTVRTTLLPSERLPSLIDHPLLQVQHFASKAVVTSPKKLRHLVRHIVQSSETPDRANVCLGIIANAPTAKAAGKIASELLDDDALLDIHAQARGRRLEQQSSNDLKRHQRQLDYLDGQ